MRPSAGDAAAGQAGFTTIELLVVMALLAVVALVAAAGFASSTTYATGSEARQTLISQAQRQVEYLASLPYDQLAHATAPATGSSDARNPRFYLDAAARTYRWDRTAAGAATAEPLAVSTSGALASDVQSWSAGSAAGKLYSYVTWVADGRCGAGCPTANNYKRVTVAATLDTGGPAVAPVYVASIVADPHAAPLGKVTNGVSNPLSDPELTCTDPSTGTQVECTQSAGSSTLTQWYLTDSPADGAYAVPAASHAPHPTVACAAGSSSGCPMPDLLSSNPTPAASPVQPLYDYSQGVSATGGYEGGRLLRRDVACSATPSADNSRGAEWITPSLGTALTLTGRGGMSISTQTLAGATGSVTICLGLYDVASLAVGASRTTLGVLSYTLASWPTTPTPVSFTFDFVPSGTVSVAAGRRIALRLWVAGNSATDIAVLYDHPNQASMLQLSSQ